MYYIERETQNFILTFRGIFLWRETVLRTHRMKSDKKLFFFKLILVFEKKMEHGVIDRYFSSFLKGFDFSSPKVSLIVPVSMVCVLSQNYQY